MRTNDLHTAALTRELAAATAASALVNTALDRNDVDLNRVTTAHDDAPRFLEILGELLEETLARHGYAVVLTIHGWNVVQASVDLGIGYQPGRHAPSAPPGPTVSVDFVASALGPLGIALAARGIGVSLGTRYPARARENLLQLFSRRYLDDSRVLVRRLARLGQRCDGVQLELGVPLRWPGRWRRRLVEGIVEALPALLGRAPGRTMAVATPSPRPASQPTRTLEFVSETLSGLLALDRAGARLLLFESEGTLGLFTGERLGGEPDGQVGALASRPTAGGGRQVRYDGPIVHFPHTTPFLDLENGLAGAAVIDASCALDYRPAHPGCPFGSIDGTVVVGERRYAVAGTAVADLDAAHDSTSWRVALSLGCGERLMLRNERDESFDGYLCRDGTHIDVVHAERTPGDGVSEHLHVRLATGEHRDLDVVPQHRLPVVRGGTIPPRCVEFTSHRRLPEAEPAGWCFRILPAPPAA
jgi:hypothetical protein